MPDDVAAHLAEHVEGGDWQVEVHEVRSRPGELPPEARHVQDVVLRARRLPSKTPQGLPLKRSNHGAEASGQPDGDDDATSHGP